MTPVYRIWDRWDAPTVAKQRATDGRFNQWDRDREQRVVRETARIVRALIHYADDVTNRRNDAR